VVQPQTQTRDYWVSDFSVTETDIEHLYNYFLEVENPQTVDQLARAVIKNRVSQEKRDIQRQMAGRTIYQPKKTFEMGEELIFPSLKFASGKVTGFRQGYNPEHGSFNVITVDLNNKSREFAAELDIEHPLNIDGGGLLDQIANIDLNELYENYGSLIEEQISTVLAKHSEFIRLGKAWFVKALLADISIGHLHLSEAVLDMFGGGPLPASEILVHLELDKSISAQVQEFSLNHALLNDDRFDEVAPKGSVAWFLNRLEPEEVRKIPERLVYKNISYDRALLSPQLRLLERELDDEWSDIDLPLMSQSVIISLTFPHRWAGTLPLSASTSPLFPVGLSPRQLVKLVDEESGEDIQAWVIQDKKYIFGLKEWYEKHKIPVGGFISLRTTPDTGVLMLNFDRRREKKEWVRLASEDNGRIRFDLDRRQVGCRYDDLLIVGTDYVAAIDGLWRKADANQRPLVSILAEIVPELAAMTPQNTVHAKTIYSAVNMLRRVPPGPIFAELVRHPAFRAVGDHYWQFDSTRWRDK
jgi:hypothetical protein